MRTALFITLFLVLMSCDGIESSPTEKTEVTPIGNKQPERNATEQNAKIDEKYMGTFSASVETEGTTSGMASIDYIFTITHELIRLETNTYQEPIRCNGRYKAVAKNRVLELYYTGDEEFCDTENPMFFLKEERGNLYVKGLGGEGTYNEWIKLERI